MAKFNVKCPYCGYINRNLYLRETGGWMECIQCGSDVNVGKQKIKMDIISFFNSTYPSADDVLEYDPPEEMLDIYCGK